MIGSFRDKQLEVFWLSKGQAHIKNVPAKLKKNFIESCENYSELRMNEI